MLFYVMLCYLRAISVGASISHGDSIGKVLDVKILVVKAATVY